MARCAGVLPVGKVGWRERACASPAGTGSTRKAGSTPASRASSIAACAHRRMIERLGQERALERVGQIERRIGHGARSGKVERLRRRGSAPARAGTAASRWLASLSVAARAAEISMRPRAWRRAPKPVSAGSRVERPVERDRPAVAQRVDRQRDARAGHGRRRSQIELRDQRDMVRTAAPSARVSSTTRWPRDCAASSGEAHMWSSRRPRSFSCQ